MYTISQETPFMAESKEAPEDSWSHVDRTGPTTRSSHSPNDEII